MVHSPCCAFESYSQFYVSSGARKSRVFDLASPEIFIIFSPDTKVICRASSRARSASCPLSLLVQANVGSHIPATTQLDDFSIEYPAGGSAIQQANDECPERRLKVAPVGAVEEESLERR
jgi:hypothetical protein